MKIDVKSADSVRLLLQIAILEGLEINVIPIPHEYMDYNDRYEVEIGEKEVR
jgi:hypothetical protein